MSYRILWIDDDVQFLQSVAASIPDIYDIAYVHSIGKGLTALQQDPTDLLLLDIDLGQDNGLESIQMFKARYPTLDIVIVSGQGERCNIMHALSAGALDFLVKPFSQHELQATIAKISKSQTLREQHHALIEAQNPPINARKMIGVSPTYRAMIAQAERLKGYGANVLVQGASGTGKELLARYLHGLEANALRPFVAINCAAIPEGLLETELFGHERGAFTGATTRKIGKFELASGGDIFLDEISALRLDLQAKILRVLQEKEIVRVGGTHPIRVNFRVIAASNDPLEALVGQGQFRVDLFHRLRVVQLQVPALSERKEDIPLLIAHFLAKYGRRNEYKRITAAALRKLQEYAWPGNIRELENVIQSMVILTPTDIIDAQHLPHWIQPHTVSQQTMPQALPHIEWQETSTPPALRDYIRVAEKGYIEHTLSKFEGDKSATAHALSIGRTTLYSKMRELGLL